MAYPNPIYGETTEIGCVWSERAGRSFIITAAEVTIVDAKGTPIRSREPAAVDGRVVYYIDTFTAENGYEEGQTYTAVFRVTIECDGVTYVEKHQGTFTVLSAADE